MGCVISQSFYFFMPTYQYSQLKSDVNAKIKGKIGILINPRDTLNRGVREVVKDADFPSMRRRSALTPNLFKKIFQYAAPTDMKGYGLINVEPQTDRQRRRYDLVPSEQFYRRQDINTISIDDSDGVKKILINTDQANDLEHLISTLDATNSGGGTWQVVGDAENISADLDNYVRENGSLKFDIGTGGTTTAGVENSSLTQFDATKYFGGNSAVFVWMWITSTTNLTNMILKIGNDTSNYYQKTVTAQADGTAFQNGWNLLKFDLASYTTTGTPVLTTFDYVSIYMTKTAGKISETSYRLDSIVLKKGEPSKVLYQSKNGWQTSGGTWIQNSTADTDYLNADDDEYSLIVKKCTEYAADEVDEQATSEKMEKTYKEDLKEFRRSNPSEVMNMISTYADFKRT